ncbi:MAG: hemerythrin domain-containing protein [Proteobacteria bacterium]|jgi:iron-sulfur cluster repair protein YtfE (RIC family)|nr:hemerythrin domain-containing protein [Pseudomonadota bacterium]
MMGAIGNYMTEHHRHCDALFARAMDLAAAPDWDGVEREGGAFLREIERHIELEETLLFPAFEEATGMTAGPTATMRSEHEEMRGLFAEMRRAAGTKDAAPYLEASRALQLLLQQHNVKEESMMYPMLDHALRDHAPDLVRQLEAAAA